MSGDRPHLRDRVVSALLRRSWAALVLCLAISMVAPTAYGQDPPALPGALHPDVARKLRSRGDLTLTQTPLPQALMIISDKWGIDIVFGDTVQGTVNGKFTDAPLHEVLQIILHFNGFGYRVVGQSLAIMKLEELSEVNPLLESAVVKLNAADATEVVEGAKVFLSPEGKIHAVASAGSLLIVDLPERVTLIENFARELDAAAASANGGSIAIGDLEVAQFAPQFITAESLLVAAQSLLTKEGKASVILEENRLVVADFSAGVARVRELVRQVDVPRPQVRITALIYDVSREDLERIGVDWAHGTRGRINSAGEAQSLWSLGSTMNVPVAPGDPSSVMTFMNLSRHIDLTMIVQALDQMRDSRLLMNPMVAVRDREIATFQIVTEVPYQQLVQTEAGGNIGTTAFREAGVTLNVIPHIADDGTIQLDVNPIFSRLAGFTSGQNPQPIIDKRETKTSVRVANAQTLVIGGLRQRSDVHDFRGIPGLKDVRYKWFHFGKLFQSQDDTTQESELLVFVTPEIISPIDCGLPRERAAMHSGQLVLDQIAPMEVCVEGVPVYGVQGEMALEKVQPHPVHVTPLEVPAPEETLEAHPEMVPPSPPPQRSSRRQAAGIEAAQAIPHRPAPHANFAPRTARLAVSLPHDRPRLRRLPPVEYELGHQPVIVHSHNRLESPANVTTPALPVREEPAARVVDDGGNWLQRMFQR